MNAEKLQGKWTEIKGEIQKTWGKLTDDDLERTKGNATAIAGLIRQHYGDAKEDVSKKLNGLLADLKETVADKTEQFKGKLKNRESKDGDF